MGAAPAEVKETITARVAGRLLDVPPVAVMAQRRRRIAEDKARTMPLEAAKRGGWGRGIAKLSEDNPWAGQTAGRPGELGRSWHQGYMAGLEGKAIAETGEIDGECSD